jgi:hypothetical protein
MSITCGHSADNHGLNIPGNDVVGAVRRIDVGYNTQGLAYLFSCSPRFHPDPRGGGPCGPPLLPGQPVPVA